MGTQTKMTAGGILRHYHVAHGRERMIWHRAGTFHPEDPDAHEREESWTEPNWQSAWRFSQEERDRLITEARTKCENTRAGVRNISSYSPSSWTRIASEPEDEEVSLQANDEDEDDNTPDDTGSVDPGTPQVDLSELEERMDNVEGVVLLVKSSLETIAGQLEDVGDFPEVLARVENLEKAQTLRVEYAVTTPRATVVTTTRQHKDFDMLLEIACALEPADRNVWVTGPAGSGKTTAARCLADAIDLGFEFQGAIDNPYKLSGFIDAGGTYRPSAFRRVYEHGGVILLDECDASSAAALLEINTALSNHYAPFPDGMIKRHDDCYVLCAANTWGFGGDANYVGRSKLDAAFLDRFVTVSWEYDEEFEKFLADNDDWYNVVNEVRTAARNAGAQIVVSPRASIKGAQLLRKGVSPARVVAAIFGRYRNHSVWGTVGRAAERFAEGVPATITVAPSGMGGVNTVNTPAGNDPLRVDMSGVRVFGGTR